MNYQWLEKFSFSDEKGFPFPGAFLSDANVEDQSKEVDYGSLPYAHPYPYPYPHGGETSAKVFLKTLDTLLAIEKITGDEREKLTKIRDTVKDGKEATSDDLAFVNEMRKKHAESMASPYYIYKPVSGKYPSHYGYPYGYPYTYQYPQALKKKMSGSYDDICAFSVDSKKFCNFEDCINCEHAQLYGCPLIFAFTFEAESEPVKDQGWAEKQHWMLKAVKLLGSDLPEVKTLKDVVALSNNEKPGELTDIEIFEVGVHKDINWTESILDTIVTNFKKFSDQYKPKLGIGHNSEIEKETEKIVSAKDGLPALGWVSDLKRVGTKLVASFKEVPNLVKEVINLGNYSRVSVELIPLASFSEEHVNYAFNSHKGSFTLENERKVGEKTMDEKKDELDAIQKSEALAKELADAKSMIQKMRDEKFSSSVDAFIVQSVTEGKLTVAQKDLVKGIMMTLSEPTVIKFSDGTNVRETTQVDLFKEFINTLKQIDFTHQSESGNAKTEKQEPEFDVTSIEGLAAKMVFEADKTGKKLDVFVALDEAERQLKKSGKEVISLLIPKD